MNKKLEEIKLEVIKYEETVNNYKKLFKEEGALYSGEQEQLETLGNLIRMSKLMLKSKENASKEFSEDKRTCYILSIVDGKLSPITLTDGTIVGYKAVRTIKKIEVDCTDNEQNIYSVYEQNQGVLSASEKPKKINSTGNLPSNIKRSCDYDNTDKFFRENQDKTTFETEPLIWFANTQTNGNQARTTQRDSQSIAIQFQRGDSPFLNATQARQSILTIFNGVPPNQTVATPWTNVSTTTETDSEGNAVNVLLQTQVQTQVRTIIRITIYTTKTDPTTVINGLGITNTQLMDRRLLNIGRVLVGNNNLRNNDVRRGTRNSATNGILWNASSTLRRNNPNYVVLDRVTTTTTTTVTQRIITPTNPIQECP